MYHPGPWSHPATGTVVPPGYRDRGPTRLPGPWSHSATGTVVPPGYRDRGPTLLPGPWSHPATGTVVPPGYRDRGPTLLPGPWSHSATGTVVPLCYRDRGPTLLPGPWSHSATGTVVPLCYLTGLSGLPHAAIYSAECALPPNSPAVSHLPDVKVYRCHDEKHAGGRGRSDMTCFRNRSCQRTRRRCRYRPPEG